MTPQAYAKAMFALHESGSNSDDIVSGVVKSLNKRGAIGLLPKILGAYEKILQSQYGKEAVLTIASEKDAHNAIAESGARADIKIKIDENIIGGYRLESDDKLLDNSFKAKLLEAYRRITQA